MIHVNRIVKDATEKHVNKNNYNRNGAFVLSQAWSFNKHVNKRKTGPSRTGRPTKTVSLATSHRSRHVRAGISRFGRTSDSLSQSPDDEDRDGPRNFDLLGV